MCVQRGSKSKAYAVYRVITAVFLILELQNVICYDFIEVKRPAIPILSKLMHFGYWTYLFLTIDYCLQVSPT